MNIAYIIVGWLTCAIVELGWFVANEDDGDDYRYVLGFGVLLALLMGPVFMFIMFFLTGFACNGWRLGPK